MSFALNIEPYPLEPLINLAVESGFSKVMMQSERPPVFCTDEKHQNTELDPVPSDSLLALIEQLLGAEASKQAMATFEPQSTSWKGHTVVIAPMRIPIKPQRFHMTVRIRGC